MAVGSAGEKFLQGQASGGAVVTLAIGLLANMFCQVDALILLVCCSRCIGPHNANRDREGTMLDSLRREGPQYHLCPKQYRERGCNTIERTGFYHTILKFPELGPDIDLVMY